MKNKIWVGLAWLAIVVAYSGLLPILLVSFIQINQLINGHGLVFQLAESAILLLFGMGLAYFAVKLYERSRGDEFESLTVPWEWRKVWLALGYGVAIVLFTTVYMSISQWLGYQEVEPKNQQLISQLMRQMPLQVAVFAGLIAPVLEEFIFRGALFRLCQVWRMNRWLGGLVVTTLFALVHAMPHEFGFAMYWIMGALLFACYVQTRNLRYVIITHFVNNAISLIVMLMD